MPPRIVVVGGGAAGIGAAGSARQVDPDARITVYTEYEDAAYSPCGIPYVHGREIPDFQSLFLQGKEAYRQAGIDIHYERRVTGLDLGDRLVHVDGEASVPFDRLVVASGFEYADPGVPGTDLEGLYYVKNIRRAMEWDKVLDDVRVAVVLDASPLGLEMVTALAHRGIETHVVDAHPWALAEVADPDIMQPVEESWAELGVKTHFNTRVEALVGDGKVRAVRTSEGELPANTWWCAPTSSRTTGWPGRLAWRSAPPVGSWWTSGWPPRPTASSRRATAWSCPTASPTSPCRGSPAATPTHRARWPAPTPRPATVPTGRCTSRGDGGREVDDRRRLLRETLATALGIPFVMGTAEGISRARYYPGSRRCASLLAEPGSLRSSEGSWSGRRGSRSGPTSSPWPSGWA